MYEKIICLFARSVSQSVYVVVRCTLLRAAVVVRRLSLARITTVINRLLCNPKRGRPRARRLDNKRDGYFLTQNKTYRRRRHRMPERINGFNFQATAHKMRPISLIY